MRLRSVILPLLVLGAGDRACAQGTLRGSVFDSLWTRRPLAGAQVMVSSVATTAVTDRNGQYVLRNLPAGRYVVSFFHSTLDSLEVSAPSLAVEVRNGQVATAHLGVPSARGISDRLCGETPAPSTAVLFGLARAAEDGALLVGAIASVRWFEVTIGSTGARQAERTAVDTTGDDGRYILCGVPNDISVSLSVTSEGQSSGALHLSLDSAEFARFDAAVSLTDTAARIEAAMPAVIDSVGAPRPAGNARIRATVSDERGRPITGAIVGVRGSEASGTTTADGSVMLAGVPSGSQTIVARAIGWAPAFRVLTLAPGREVELRVTLTKSPMALPEVSVLGRRRSSVEKAFDARRRAGFGHYYEGVELDLARKSSAFWVRIPGVTLHESGDLDPMPMMTGIYGARSKCFPTVWVDGVSMTSITGWELRSYMLGASRLEVYTRNVQTPTEFQSPTNPCGSIVVWTY
jgi:hypothetical protein